MQELDLAQAAQVAGAVAPTNAPAAPPTVFGALSAGGPVAAPFLGLASATALA